MKRFFFITILFMIPGFILNAQRAPNVMVDAIKQTADSGFIIAGSTIKKEIGGIRNHGNNDMYVMKVDKDGKQQWQMLYGGSGSDNAADIIQTADSGYIIAGKSGSNNLFGLSHHGKTDLYIVKIDKHGKVQWQKLYGGKGYDQANKIKQTKEGDYIIAAEIDSDKMESITGYGDDDCFIMKIDKNGNVKWQKAIGGSSYESVYGLELTDDGGMVIAGSSASNDIPDTPKNCSTGIYVVKMDKDGEILWQRIFDAGKYNRCSDIKKTADGGFIVAGSILDLPGPELFSEREDCYIFKLDKDGYIEWQRIWGGSDYDSARSITEVRGAGYTVAGISMSKNLPGSNKKSRGDCYLFQINQDGLIQWQVFFGGSGFDAVYALEQTDDEGFILAGISDSKDIPGSSNTGDDRVFIIKTNKKGELLWQKQY